MSAGALGHWHWFGAAFALTALQHLMQPARLARVYQQEDNVVIVNQLAQPFHFRSSLQQQASLSRCSMSLALVRCYSRSDSVATPDAASQCSSCFATSTNTRCWLSVELAQL